ncbi:O-antigen polysaccharide polymerase Wzy [Microbacterium oleivorans]|uniref:O-antigen polysaccharide polymerase Wzy n=1 Tax=Microbacterium oleivorans TaxID=273677 RepID=UPI000767CDA9|nr:O-antigen polysaccharide polymerase Wzy [Microbacterium oleivorans]
MTRSPHEAALSELRIGGASFAVIYLVLLCLVAPLLIVAFEDGAYSVLAATIGLALAFLAMFEMRRVGHPLTPAGIAAIGGILIFALRPITVQSSGYTTPGALLDSRTFVGPTVDAGVASLGQVATFYAAFGVCYFLIQARRRVAANTMKLNALCFSETTVRRAGLILVFVTIFAVGCAVLLVQSSGGLAAHFSGVSVRSSFLAGRYYLTLGYLPLTVALVMYVLVRRFAGLREWNGGALLAAAVLVAVGFTTGGRGPLLLGVILPILILKQTGPSRFTARTLTLIGGGLLVGAMTMSLFLREGVYDEGASIRALQANPLGTLMERLTSGAETRPFDSLILLNEVDAAGQVPWLFGRTYAAVPTWFVPGDLIPWKDGGANTWFTREYVPRFYYPDKIETSISAIGEAYANFRWVGIVVVGVLVAVAAAKLSVRRSGDGFMKTTTIAVLTPLFFSFIRGDAFQNLSTVILILAFIGLFRAGLGRLKVGEGVLPAVRMRPAKPSPQPV